MVLFVFVVEPLTDNQRRLFPADSAWDLMNAYDFGQRFRAGHSPHLLLEDEWIDLHRFRQLQQENMAVVVDIPVGDHREINNVGFTESDVDTLRVEVGGRGAPAANAVKYPGRFGGAVVRVTIAAGQVLLVSL